MKLSFKNIAAFLFLFPFIAAYPQNFESKHFKIEKIKEGIFAAINKPGGFAISNSGIIDLGDVVLVFDTFISPEAAEDLKRAAEQLTLKPVKYVINSHYHNDHIRGNQVFENAVIIATSETRDLIQKNEPEELDYEKSTVDQNINNCLKKLEEEKDSANLEEDQMWLGYYKAIKGSFNNYKITLPNFTIDDSLYIHGTKRRAVIFTNGKGHTESDLVLWLPEDKVLFAGDLVFAQRHPWLGDGSITGWINYLNKLSELRADVIIPGHGPLTNNNGIDSMIKYINLISNIVDDAIKLKTPEDKLKEIPIPSELKNWQFENFFIPNLINLYELKKGIQ
ncbi:MAG TPA: MBL fold metallo-hydrolase [Ignavibacteriaceae bacterium]|nr:MBL fold metallo-hydrolase [Ignavibacteriaceae bacterium]